MDARVIQLLAQRTRVRKAESAQSRLIAATIVQHVSMLVSLLMLLSYPSGVWLSIACVGSLWACVAGGLLQFHLRERATTIVILGTMMLIPGVSLLVLSAVLYESRRVLAIARTMRVVICPRCEYNLKGLPAGAPCPECGTHIDE